MLEAVMATHKTKSRKLDMVRGAAFAILGLAGLAGIQQITSHLVCFLGIPLEIALNALPSILLRGWHMLQPYAFGHLRLLEGLLHISASWRLVLTLTGV